MRSPNEQQVDFPNNLKELRVLTQLEVSPDITQRQLSQRVGLALGLTNALMRNLIRKGYLRSRQASWKRWIYSLTPEGMTHKIRLTVHYVHRFLDHYKNIRDILREQLEPLALHAESRVAIIGTGEFAELVYLCLRELNLSEIDIFARNLDGRQRFLGMPIRDLAALDYGDYDRILIANLNEAQGGVSERSADIGSNSDKVVNFFKEPY